MTKRAVLGCVLLVAGCVATPAPTPGSARPAAVATAQPSLPTPSVSPTPSPDSSLVAGYLEVSPPQVVVFAGFPTTMSVDAGLQATVGSLGIDAVTVSFGDGSSSSLTPGCAARVHHLSIVHTYARAGVFQVRVTSGSLCGGSFALDAGYPVQVHPSASPASSTWPFCTTFQLDLTGGGVVLALGNGGAMITARNTSSSSCQLDGYPRIVLIGRSGAALPTDLTDATNGAYLFMAIPAHRVALAPGDFASFEIAFTDNPSGANANEPYQVACPEARSVRVYYPQTGQYGTAALRFAPCDGRVSVSPFFPGSTWIGPNG